MLVCVSGSVRDATTIPRRVCVADRSTFIWRCKSHTYPWAHTYNISAAGEYRRTSLSLLDRNIAKGEDRVELIPWELGVLFFFCSGLSSYQNLSLRCKWNGTTTHPKVPSFWDKIFQNFPIIGEERRNHPLLVLAITWIAQYFTTMRARSTLMLQATAFPSSPFSISFMLRSVSIALVKPQYSWYWT